jgi:ER degradation enhancer, mannosidase alpha-like 1
VLGNFTEFERGVVWLSENLTFDVDARVNLFEVNLSLNLKLPVREPMFFL